MDNNTYVREPDGRLRIPGTITEKQLFRVAEDLMTARYTRGGPITSPASVGEIFKARFATCTNEVFSCMFLDTRHSLISLEDLFYGSIAGCEIHPRVVAKRALELNAAAVIVAHPHPSGIAEPSAADRSITTQLRDALNLIEVRLLDHFVVGGNTVISMAARGWL